MPFDVTIIDPVDHHVVNLLEHVKAILSREHHWTKRHNQIGHLWWRRFCVAGAIMHATAKHNYTFDSAMTLRDNLDSVARRHGYESIVSLNDDIKTTHRFVLAVLNETQHHVEHLNAITP